MPASNLAKILCVDDEPQVLDGLALHLQRQYDMLAANSGEAGLELLRKHPDTVVIISDMRMPGMDGSTFLRRAREVAPDATRMLLTGQTDLDSAIAAVNRGQIFRFLTKPCLPTTLLVAIDAAQRQHQLITSERVLLEQTLHGSIKALMDVLSLMNPVAFGRAARIKKLVTELAEKLDVRERWQIEVAAMLSQLGCITLPTETVEKLYFGQDLSDREQQMVDNIPATLEQLLGNIPRLEIVRGILVDYRKSHRYVESAQATPEKRLINWGAQLLKLASDFDILETQGTPVALAIDTMRGRGPRYDTRALEALAEICSPDHRREQIRELTVSALRAGMVFAEDVKMVSGVLLVTRGHEVTSGFIERVKNFRPGTVREPIRVIVQTDSRDD